MNEKVAASLKVQADAAIASSVNETSPSDLTAVQEKESTTSMEKVITSPEPPTLNEETQSQGLININKASLSELQNIPGIGEKKAGAIVDYRNQHGSFTKIDDLLNVKGIGEKMLEKMKPYIEH